MENKILKELKDLKKQIKDIKDYESKYLFSTNHEIVTAILNKLSIDNITISYEEVEKFKFDFYVAYFDNEAKIITIKKNDDYDV